MSRRAGRLVIAGVLVAFLGGCASVGGPWTLEDRARVYVVGQDDASATVLDASDGSVLARMDFTELGYGANSRPHHVAVDPDGLHWYVSLIGAGRVLRIDRYHRVVDESRFEAAGMLALDPTSDWLYVGRSMAAVNPPRRIGMVRRSAMALSEVDVFFPRPHALTVEPGTGRAYVASLAENRMAVMEIGAEEVDLVEIDGPLHTLVQLAASPNGRWLVGGGQMSGELLVWELGGAEPELVTTVRVGGQPWHPTFTPDGSEVWIPNLTANSVTVVETGSWRVAATVTHPALVEPHGSTASADGRAVFVSARNTTGTYGAAAPGTVVAIDVRSREVLWVAEVGAYAAGIAAWPPADRPD